MLNQKPIRFVFLSIACCSILLGYAQNTQVNEGLAKEAVYRIVQYSGLEANFIVLENEEIKTAIAYIKNKKRYVAYNPTFIATIVDSSETDWAAVSILAHEIAHHLLGHTLNPTKVSLGDELACDKYSGFILRNMGASLEESVAAMQIAGNPHGTKTHPPSSARLKAIEQGWGDPDRLRTETKRAPLSPELKFKYKLRFYGDENNYYVNQDDKVVWFNNHAEPIEFGACEVLENSEFAMLIKWNEQSLFVDYANDIWSKSAHGVQTKVGNFSDLIDEQ